jgi:hypothetical protein
MIELNLKSWDEFKNTLKELEVHREIREESTNRRASTLLFRGHSDSRWGLTTTLEGKSSGKDMPFLDYCRVTSKVRRQIETFAAVSWEGVSEYPDLEKWVNEQEQFSLPLINFPAYARTGSTCDTTGFHRHY